MILEPFTKHICGLKSQVDVNICLKFYHFFSQIAKAKLKSPKNNQIIPNLKASLNENLAGENSADTT